MVVAAVVPIGPVVVETMQLLSPDAEVVIGAIAPLGSRNVPTIIDEAVVVTVAPSSSLSPIGHDACRYSVNKGCYRDSVTAEWLYDNTHSGQRDQQQPREGEMCLDLRVALIPIPFS